MPGTGTITGPGVGDWWHYFEAYDLHEFERGGEQNHFVM